MRNKENPKHFRISGILMLIYIACSYHTITVLSIPEISFHSWRKSYPKR